MFHHDFQNITIKSGRGIFCYPRVAKLMGPACVLILTWIHRTWPCEYTDVVGDTKVQQLMAAPSPTLATCSERHNHV